MALLGPDTDSVPRPPPPPYICLFACFAETVGDFAYFLFVCLKINTLNCINEDHLSAFESAGAADKAFINNGNLLFTVSEAGRCWRISSVVKPVANSSSMALCVLTQLKAGVSPSGL